MSLKEYLQSERTALTQKWLEATMESYAKDTSSFFLHKRDRFHNPVGHSFSNGIEAIFTGLLNETDPDELQPALDEIIRIRAIQSFSPAQAVSFIILLKSVLREECKSEMKNHKFLRELLEFESRIDEVVLVAFNVYARCRERVSELRVNDIKRRVSGLLRRTGWMDEECQNPERGGGQ